MNRSAFLALVLACCGVFPLAGCWSEFKSQREELAYLESLSNPTPSQWKRREELRGKKDTWPPEPRSVVTIPNSKLIILFSTLDVLRKDIAITKADSWRDVAASEKAGHAVYTPEFEAVSDLCITTLFPGAKVKILDIGDDYVHVEFVADSKGDPVKPTDQFKGDRSQNHGYAEKWWTR